jgi:hypothetical protein
MQKNIFLFFHKLILFLGIGYIGTALSVFIIFGPIETKIFGNRISLTSLANPIRISLGLYLLGFIFKALGTYKDGSIIPGLLKKLWLMVKTGGERVIELNPSERGTGHRRWIEPLCLILVFWSIFFFIHRNTADVAGFADTYGYVSEAVRLSQGHFYEPEQVYSFFGLPEEAEKTHPLGYTEKGSQGTVPTYPFGYPLMMAAFIKVFGLQGAYWVTPLLAAGTILLTYWLGRAYLGRLGGVIAAGFVLFLPNFLHSSFFPMSDVPATFFSALALVFLLVLRPSRLADLLLGASLGVGIWVRPNLVLLALPVAAWFIIRKEWPRLLRFGLMVFPFILANGLLNGYLYGSVWTTGYGNPPIGDTLSNTLDRGIRHLMRLKDQQAGFGIFLLLMGLLFGRLSLAGRLLLVGIFTVFLVFFSAYRWDDAWWYFRFLLPTMPAVAVLEASFLMQFISTGKKRKWDTTLILLVFFVFSWASINFSNQHFVFNDRISETKYPKAASMVLRNIKYPALIFAMLYSGPLRFYANLPTARYDLASVPELTDRIQAVKKAGGHVYLVLDNWEYEKMIKTETGRLLDFARTMDSISDPDKVWLFDLNVPWEPDRK